MNSIKSKSNEINLEYSAENLDALLQGLIQEKSIYTHEDFANWIYKFVISIIETFDKGNEIDSNLEDIVNDIDAQWELNLANSYTLEELKNMDFSTVKFPTEWLKNWKEKLHKT